MANGSPEVLTVVLTALGSGGVVQIINTFFTNKNEAKTVAIMGSEKALNMMAQTLDRADKQIKDLQEVVVQMRSELDAVKQHNTVIEAELTVFRASQERN